VASAQYRAETPSAKTLYRSGPSGRYLLGGTWLFRLDPANVGIKQGFQRDPTDAGWNRTTVPNAWNATDQSVESFQGTVGWYRKDFRLPSAARRLFWIVRFESVNYRARIWLNGKPIGTNRGAYLPFEIRLPASLLKRSGTNRLVIRVDNHRFGTDFPPAGLSISGKPTGGWWNYGGLLREVYLRKVDGIDFNTVQVRPNLPCATCAATVSWRVTLRNYAGRAIRVRLTGRYGRRRVELGTKAIGAKRFATFTRTVRIARPRIWSPASPSLYDAPLQARSGKRIMQRYALSSGIRSIKVSPDGRLLLNGRPLNFRGVGLHEDSLTKGFAIDNAIRDRILAATEELGATIIRSHYPLHPYTQEQADRLGITQWSEIPVYAVKTQYLKQRLVRKLAARELESNILSNQNHPSVIVWSIGNELSARPGPVQSFYIARAANAAKRLDPTRPVGYAVAGYPAAGCQPEYGPLDVIGINEYFGWYPGPNGQIADRATLSEYLDGVRQCYPSKAIVISEFGAEANRDGPIEEKGTFQHQQDFVNYHLGVHGSKPWLSGSIYWALEEFRVRPGWEGGNPRPQQPIHQKGLITFDGRRKPAFFDVQRIFRGTTQLRAARRR
jgi:beta-glucuronidase